MKLRKHLFTLILTISVIFNISVPAFASNVVEQNIEKNTVEFSSIQPRGVLSGYGQGSTNHSGNYFPHEGEFWFDVTGSWSVFAGCTIKTDGFSNDDIVTVTVYDQDGNEKCSKNLEGATDEKKNIPIFNVSPGRYHVTIWVLSGTPGTVKCWIY